MTRESERYTGTGNHNKNLCASDEFFLFFGCFARAYLLLHLTEKLHASNAVFRGDFKTK